jgi:dihydrofolate reductase
MLMSPANSVKRKPQSSFERTGLRLDSAEPRQHGGTSPTNHPWRAMTEHARSRITIHMAASLDGFIARRDGRVDWLETSDTYEGGETMTKESVEAFLDTIDCYVMGSRTYQTAADFVAKGFGWPYGDTPTFVLTSRKLQRTRNTVEFYSGNLRQLVDERLKPNFRSIWFVGGGQVCGECLRLGLADEVRYSILPILIGDGISFFDRLDEDVPLHLLEAKPYRSGMVELRYEVRKSPFSGSARAPAIPF